MNPEWRLLRGLQFPTYFLFSPTEKDMMLGMLLTHNIKNKMAFEYLLGYTLLNRDIESFMKYYPLGRNMGYSQIPRSYQEVLAFSWSQQNNSFDGMPWNIAPQVKSSMESFARIYTQQQSNTPNILKDKFGHTYWSYLLLKN